MWHPWKTGSAAMLLGALLGASWCPAADADQENPLLRELIEQGIVLSGQQSLRLPSPTLPDGLSAQAQRQALAVLVDANHTWEALTRPSVVAPFVLKQGSEPSPSTLRSVDLWFVVHGDLSRLGDEAFLTQGLVADQQEAKDAGPAKARALDQNFLAARQISVHQPEERFHYLSVSLFDRVQVQAVSQAWVTRQADSTVVAARIDPRFATDAEVPNRWSRLVRPADAASAPSQPQRYDSAAWYIKATRLHEPVGAVLVEVHVRFDEPQAWFDGANLLRSKLPLVVQDSVRKFRRRAAEPK